MTAAQAPAEPDELARVWSGYARKVYGSYSPLNASLARSVSESSVVLEFVRRQPPHAHDPNMLLAAIQYLVIGGTDHPLGACYTADAIALDDASLTPLVESFCESHSSELSRLLSTRRIQTNEVGRAPGLALGLACASKQIGEPLSLVDAGASAGLNLLMDRYRLRYGVGFEIGPSDSTVVIDCNVEPHGLPLPHRLPVISDRVGLDRDPVDLTVPDNARWLLACIWPGTGRQDRARAAMQLVAADPPRLLKGDMAGDLARSIESVRPGQVAVVTSWSFSYLPADDRRAFESELASASHRGVVAWVCCDTAGVSHLFQPSQPPPDAGDIPSVLGLAVFDSGDVTSSCLGYMHSHGLWLRWLDGTLTPDLS